MPTMGKTILLGTTLAVVFAVFMIAPALAGGHLFFDEAVIDDDEVEFTVTADIPTDGLTDFGYGAFTTTDDTLVVVVTHPGVGLDSEEQEFAADPVFHSHLVTLSDAPDDCSDAPGNFFITFASFEEVADFEVEGNQVEIEADEELTGVVVAFKLDTADGEVCVEVTDSIVAAADDDDDDDD